MKTRVTFEMGTLSERGVIHLSQAGLDVVRSLLMRWIAQADRGETVAMTFAEISENPFSVGQAKYFRAAGSFLLARLTSHLTSRVNIAEELRTLTRWADGQPMPEKWQDCITEALQLENPDGTLDLALGGSRTGLAGGDITTAVGGGQPGQTATPTADTEPPPGDSAKGGKSDGKATRRKGGGRAKANR